MEPRDVMVRFFGVAFLVALGRFVELFRRVAIVPSSRLCSTIQPDNYRTTAHTSVASAMRYHPKIAKP